MRRGTIEDNKNLFTQIKKVFEKGRIEKRVVTTPAGAEETQIYWLKSPGIWACLFSNVNNTALICQFGSSLPRNKKTPITMDVQINLALKDGRRDGATIIDDQKRLYLGHVGRLGGGRANVPAENFRSQITGFQAEEVNSGVTSASYFVIGPVNALNFTQDIHRYVTECSRIRKAARGLSTEARGLPADGGDDRAEPTNQDEALERRNASIKYRRGQQVFRMKLVECYGATCAISGCDVLAVLEAAHLKPFDGGCTDMTSNGLLLRADLHTLMDCGLLAIHPIRRIIVLSPKLKGSISYKELNGTRLKEPEKPADRPSVENLNILMKRLLR